MNDWPFSNFPAEQYAALSIQDRELCVELIRAYLAEIALQEQIGMRRPPAEDM